MRLVLFADPELACSVGLLAACLRAAAGRGDVEVVAVVDTARAPPPPLRAPRAIAAWALRAVLNANTAAAPERPPLVRSSSSLARRRRVPLLAPRVAGVNDRSFVESLQRLEPDAAIALMVAQIFHAPLLAAVGTPVNFHDGLLPYYQGVAATGWSIYDGAPRSGFSFHLMSEQVDRGRVLLQDAVPLGPTSATAPVVRAKTRLAATRVNALFDLLSAPARGAEPTDEPGSSFSRADLRAIRTVEAPEQLSLAELERRLRAFEILDLTLAGRRWRTTALRRVGRRPRDRRLAFTTADGVAVEPSRLLHLPPRAYRALGRAIRSA